jgi:hypothetical protein
MPTPSIQTLVNDAQSVLALQNMTYIRSVMAVALANANTGTPLSTSLTNQQLINEARQVITLPKSDIESIIVNQMMKFLATPPAPGGVGADKQVIWNDAGVLTGDPNFTWDGPLSLLNITGAATITGDLTVDTSTLKVDSANNRVGIGTASPSSILHISNTAAATRITITDDTTNGRSGYIESNYSDALVIGTTSGVRAIRFSPDNKVCHLIEPSGTFTWYDGAGGTRMTLNANGLGVGVTPTLEKLQVNGGIVISPPATPATLTTNGQLTVNATSNTNLRFSYRGSDGTTRTANITLA